MKLRLTEFSKKCSDYLQFWYGGVVLTNLEKYHQKLVPRPHKKRHRPFKNLVLLYRGQKIHGHRFDSKLVYIYNLIFECTTHF